MKTLCLLLLPLLAMAQESILPQPGPKTETFGRKWTISASLGGWQLGGPPAAIVQRMNETGWASRSPGGCFFVLCAGPADYPRVLEGLSYDLEVGYRKSARRGIMVSLGLPLTAGITGRAPNGGFTTYLDLQSRLWYVSYRWAWFSTNGRLVGSVGPALLLVQDFEGIASYNYSARHTQVRPGLHVNGQFRLVNRRTWLMALKVDARMGLPSSTTQYEKTTFMSTPTGNQEKILTFPSLTTSTFHMNIGFQVGSKIL